jgi:hypothetical protein
MYIEIIIKHLNIREFKENVSIKDWNKENYSRSCRTANNQLSSHNHTWLAVKEPFP